MGRRDKDDHGYEQMLRVENPYETDTETEAGLGSPSPADEDGRNAARRAAADWGAPWLISDDED